MVRHWFAQSCFLQLLYREAVLWYNIDHSNILTFTGVSERIPQLPGLSFVLPWAEHMDLARYLDNLRSEGLSGKACVQKINKWVRFLLSRIFRLA